MSAEARRTRSRAKTQKSDDEESDYELADEMDQHLDDELEAAASVSTHLYGPAPGGSGGSRSDHELQYLMNEDRLQKLIANVVTLYRTMKRHLGPFVSLLHALKRYKRALRPNSSDIITFHELLYSHQAEMGGIIIPDLDLSTVHDRDAYLRLLVRELEISRHYTLVSGCFSNPPLGLQQFEHLKIYLETLETICTICLDLPPLATRILIQNAIAATTSRNPKLRDGFFAAIARDTDRETLGLREGTNVQQLANKIETSLAFSPAKLQSIGPAVTRHDPSSSSSSSSSATRRPQAWNANTSKKILRVPEHLFATFKAARAKPGFDREAFIAKHKLCRQCLSDQHHSANCDTPTKN